jgi:hypothetical protein
LCKGAGKSVNRSVWVKEKLDFMDAEADDVGRIKGEGRETED